MSGALCELGKIALPSNLPSENPHEYTLADKKDELFWYFGYGSNLNSETFLIKRGIRPLRQLRLLVPGWRLNFEIAGIPYAEPGFGSIDQVSDLGAKTDPRPVLQGMAYLVTSKDYWHIIATVGGNSSYRQIKLQAIDPMTKETFNVWSLQAVRPRRFCQPSVRYITIIREGAKEHGFPQEYLEYLNSIQPFVLHGKRQKIGAMIFIGFWMPIITWIFAMRLLLTKPNGDGPAWLTRFTEITFRTCWEIHDRYWAERFGRGDHNVSDEESSRVRVVVRHPSTT